MAPKRTMDLVDRPDPDDDSAVVSAGKGIGKAVASTIMNGIWSGVLVVLGAIGLPFIGPAWPVVLPALLAERAVSAGKEFMLAGYRGNSTIHLAKLARHGAGAFANLMLWQNYPFIFTAIGLPPMVDTVVPWVFCAFAIIHGTSGLVSFIKIFTGSRSRKDSRGRRGRDGHHNSRGAPQDMVEGDES